MAFRRRAPMGRAALLEAAAAARRRRRWGRAAALYREVLDRDASDAPVEAKLAACLAEAGDRAEAWVRYRSAAAAYADKGFEDKSAAVLREAARHFPREPEVWEGIAAVHAGRGRRQDAISVLLEGRRHLRGRRHRAAAIRLLVGVLRIDANHFRAELDLADLLLREGRGEEVERLLARFEAGRTREEKRRLHQLQMRLAPSAAAVWRWVRAA